MAPFAGYHMPLAYGDVSQGSYPSLSSPEVSDAPLVASHQHVRQSAGLFDVGHMVQSKYAPQLDDISPHLNKETLVASAEPRRLNS